MYGKSIRYSNKPILGIYSGFGYSRIISKKLAFETSLKYLTPIAKGLDGLKEDNNLLIDIGLNYKLK